MTYRESIKHVFKESQSALQEYTVLCLKAHDGREITEELLNECDYKFKEYNRLLSIHHELLMKLTKNEIKLDDVVTGRDVLRV